MINQNIKLEINMLLFITMISMFLIVLIVKTTKLY